MPDPGGVIRTVQADDVERIHEIAVAAWMPIFERYRMIVGEAMWNDVFAGWDTNWFRKEPEQWDDRGIVTELDGEVAGFASWALGEGRVAEVGGNAVDPGLQGRGIGAAQIKWVLDMFRERGFGVGKVYTGMDPAHGPARSEYRKAGLRVGVAKSRYYNYLEEVARVPARAGVTFRWARPEDAALIRSMAASAWAPVGAALRSRLGDPIFDLAFPDWAEVRAEELSRQATAAPEAARLVLLDGRPAGFAIIGIDEAKSTGDIASLGVVPEHGCQGLGGALCMDAFGQFRERGLAYAQLTAAIGEVNEQTRQLCWNAGLYRELPSIEYYTKL